MIRFRHAPQETVLMPRTTSMSIPLFVVIGCALVGAWAGGTLLIAHDGGWEANRGGIAAILGLCESTLLPSTSCAEVVGSQWGSIDLTLGGTRYVVPTSFLGLAYFGAMTVWFGVLGLLRAGTRRLWGWSVGAIGGGVLASVALVAVMVGVLPHWCPLCGIAHVANAGALMAAIVLWRRSSPTDAAGEGRAVVQTPLTMPVRAGALAVVAIAVMVSLGWFYYDAMRSAKRQWHKVAAYRELVERMRSDPAFLLREYFAQPVVELGPAAVATGPPDGPRLIVFGNSGCKACACFMRRWNEDYSRSFAREVSTEFRAVSVEGPSRGHEVRPRENGSRFSGNRASQQVQGDMNLARALGIQRTPAVFLNGRRVPELCVKNGVFWEAVAQALNEEDEVMGVVSSVFP